MLSKHKLRYLFGTMIATIAITLIAASLTLSVIKNSFTDSLAESLRAVSSTTYQAIHLWAQENEDHANILASNPVIVSQTRELLSTPNTQEALVNSDAQTSLRKLLAPILQTHEMRGFFILDKNNISLASTRNSNIGTINLLASQKGFLDRAWQGETLTTLPQKSDVPLPNKEGQLIENYPTMFVASPIRDFDGKIIALLTLRLDPIEKLQKILNRSQIGRTGETYLFDEHGVMISDSRFEDELKQRKILADNESSIFTTQIKIPTLVSNGKPELTVMAQSALSGQSNYNIEGYVDYRGTTVVGAWLWDPIHEFGLATELDYDEAYIAYNQTRDAFIIFAFCIISVTLFITFLFYRLINKIRRQKRDYINLLENASDPILLSSVESQRIIAANDMACNFLEYKSDELANLSLSNIYSDKDGDYIDFSQTHVEKEFVTRSGVHKIVEIGTKYMKFNSEMVILSIIRDITEKKANESKLISMLNMDLLTGLGNRQAIDAAIEHNLNQNDVDSAKFMIALLDLSDLRLINDTLGLKVGDETLKTVADKLSQTFDKDALYRLTGGEFAIVLPISSPASITPLCKKITQIFQQPACVKDHSLELSVSIGVAIAPQHGNNSETLLKAASSALSKAKNSRSSSYILFSEDMLEESTYQLLVSSALNKAIGNNEFTLVYQPIYCIDQQRLAGAEALIRWKSHTIGSVPPNIFIPIAEHSGKINEIGAWVIEQVCQQMGTWSHLLEPHHRVSINISAAQLFTSNLVEQVKAALDKHGVEGKHIGLEITENIYLGKNEDIIEQLGQLKDLGIELYLDDFGTGYSSLSYLNSYPFDIIKLDRSYISELESSRHSKTLAKTIITLAKSLDLKVVAEGVEERWQLDSLKSLGCCCAQGYLFDKPLKAHDFEAKWLKNKSLTCAPINSISDEAQLWEHS
ncbi:EAL domain-containing protein [Vibrio sp. SCSIO 43136]|uniref:EAL domain-containing protein n=1 Tax=Vibrio sp. SCSIO 43136 TaxID=2819101 RepID=UPI002075C386|nr:EAL domain-containing protein [Vibrio sp. SCSIO 43136]USD67736.1 EAL domain-containing protein [Vibrio sp. SCSIO 43136]